MRRAVMLALALGALLMAVSLAFAQGGYDLSWFTVSGGGGATSGGSYTLTGSAGQSDAGSLTGGAYALSGGFMLEGVAAGSGQSSLYLPLIQR